MFNANLISLHIALLYSLQIMLLRHGRQPQAIDLPPQMDPRGLTSRGQRVFICDHGNQCVQTFDLDLHAYGDVTKPVFSTISLGKPNDLLPISPYFISVNPRDARILVTDYANGRLICARIDNAERARQVPLKMPPNPSRDPSRLPSTSIDIRPTGVAWMPTGRGAVVADQLGHRLVIVDDDLMVVGTYGRQGSGDGEFLFPHGLDFVSKDILAVCDMNNARVQFIVLRQLLEKI